MRSDRKDILYVLHQVALLLGFGLLCFDPTGEPELCVASACLVHLAFTAAFTFYLLESKCLNIVQSLTFIHPI